MKYTPRHIRRFLEQGRIDATRWNRCFPSLLPTRVPVCSECTEFRDTTCPGGRDPVDCFLAQGAGGPDTGQDEGKKKKKHDPMLGLGAKEPGLHGTAKPRDQSKM